jgi:hypothetical protein
MSAMSVVCPGYSALFTQLSDARHLSVKSSDTRRWIREYGKKKKTQRGNIPSHFFVTSFFSVLSFLYSSLSTNKLSFSFFFSFSTTADCWDNCLSSAPCPQTLIGMHFTDVALVRKQNRIVKIQLLIIDVDSISSAWRSCSWSRS